METFVDERLGLTTEVKTLVGHINPDDDVWLCFWMAKKFVKQAAKAEMVYVNAGESLEGSDGDPSVLHFDTGGGEFDQHGKCLTRTCSAAMFVAKAGLNKDPGLQELLEMVTAVDNAEKLPATSIHYVIVGYSRLFNSRSTNDWQRVQERVFELFDIVYAQEVGRAEARANLEKFARWQILPNGLKVCTIFKMPQLREAAYEAGAAVVLWTTRPKKDKSYVGIQVNREFHGRFDLETVVAWLRYGEAQVQGIDVQSKDLFYIGREGPIVQWFLHDSGNLILNGSNTWKLTEDEYTELSPKQIEIMVHQALQPLQITE